MYYNIHVHVDDHEVQWLLSEENQVNDHKVPIISKRHLIQQHDLIQRIYVCHALVVAPSAQKSVGDLGI